MVNLLSARGNLVLRLPANYAIVSSPADSIRNFDSDNMIVEWDVEPIGLTPVGLFDSLQIFMTNIPIDSNTSDPVVVSSRENKLGVQVQDAAAISIVSDIVAPEGATDSSLTAGQSFTFRSTITFNGSVAATGRTAQIVLPANYSVENNSPLNLAGTDEVIVNWNVVASPQVDGLDTIYIQVNANDANVGVPLQRTSDPYIVTLVTPALLSLGTAISNPAGAADNIVSTGQEIVLQTTVSNLGQAGFDTSGILQMTASNGVVFKRHRISGVPNSVTNAIDKFQAGIYTDTLIVPNNQTNAEITVKLLEEDLPADENSGNSVLVRRDSASVALQVINRANLVVHLDKSSAVNDTLIRTTNQAFKIKAFVNNTGIAGIDTSRWLRLDLSQSALQFNSDQARKFYTINNPVEWNVISPSTESTGIIYVADDSQPEDENDGLNAFRTPAESMDSLYVDFRAVNDINIASVFIQNNNDSLIVSTEQDSILISSDILFDPILDADKTVTLILPPQSGFASLDTNLTKEITSQSAIDQQWLIRAPASSINWRPLVIRAQANSTSIPGLPTKIMIDTLYIRTEPKASLSLSLQIVEPSGALDDSLSYGQSFKLQALVKNKENVAGIEGSGMASIQINEFFSLIDTLGISAEVQKSFTVGEPFFWWIRVNEAAAASMSRVNFLSMINKKLTEPAGPIQLGVAPSNTIDVNRIFEIKKTYSGEAVDLAVQIDELPLDENTLKPAYILNSLEAKTVYLEQKAKISIAETSIPSEVSTGQTFEYSVSGVKNENLINPFAYIEIPSTIGSSPDPIALDMNNQAKVTVTIPANYQGTGQETFRVFLVGTDINTGLLTSFSPTVENAVNVVFHPVLQLNKIEVTPAYADTSGVISRGQKMIVQLQPGYAFKDNALNWAQLNGSGSVSISSNIVNNTDENTYFSLVEGSGTQTFTQAFETLSWTIKAPKQRDLTASIEFSFNQTPLDANSGIAANIDQNLGKITIPIRVRKKSVTVTLQNELISGEYYSRDTGEDSLMVFTINNHFDDSLYVRNLELAFHSDLGEPSDDNLFKSTTLARIFKSIHVAEYADPEASTAKTTKSFISPAFDYTLSDTSHNPLKLFFDEDDVLLPNESRTYVVTTAFQENTVSRSFQVVLTGLHAYDFDSSILLDIVDEEGILLENSDLFISNRITVISNSLKDDFYNYPNPFGRGAHPYTTFHFRLERPSDVQIRIFTLLGELVWSRNGNFDQGISDGEWIWDGKNDRGKTVLNGVYLCYIDIKPVSGGGSKRFLTKIAYIK